MKRERVKLHSIGNRIKDLRKNTKYIKTDTGWQEIKNEITQLQFSEIMNVTLDTVKNWEQHYNYPSVDTLVKIADIFRCDFDYLMGKQDFPNKVLEHISLYTGISNEAAFILHESFKQNTNLYKIASDILEDTDILLKIYDCCLANYGSVSQLIEVPDIFNDTHPTLIRPKDIRKADTMQLYQSLCTFIDKIRKKNGLPTSDEL